MSHARNVILGNFWQRSGKITFLLPCLKLMYFYIRNQRFITQQTGISLKSFPKMSLYFLLKLTFGNKQNYSNLFLSPLKVKPLSLSSFKGWAAVEPTLTTTTTCYDPQSSSSSLLLLPGRGVDSLIYTQNDQQKCHTVLLSLLIWSTEWQTSSIY